MNAGNPNYIRPLDKDVKEVFDPSKNKALRQGKIQRWLLKSNDGALLGRIAAFVNPKYTNKGDKVTPGGLGFFECIDDQEAANLLFDTAKEWLAAEGKDAMDGPINMGERDKWWGLLVEGFHPAQYNINYNPPYYQKLFETYGFEVFYYQNCYGMSLEKDAQLDEKFYKTHAQFEANTDFEARHFKKNQLEKFARDFCTVYNGAWSGHAGNKTMAEAQAIKIFRSMKPVIHEKLVWFVYHKETPVAMWLNLPDINQIFKHMNGKFNPWSKLKFLYYKTFVPNHSFVGLVFGVVPEFQGTGVDSFMIVSGEAEIKKHTAFNQLELQWQGDFNPKINNISKNIGATIVRRLATYRYTFDRSMPFERHPII